MTICVLRDPKPKAPVSKKVKDIMDEAFSGGGVHLGPCFIGKVGDGPDDDLYMATYDGVILVRNPYSSWDGNCPVAFTRWVNVELTVHDLPTRPKTTKKA